MTIVGYRVFVGYVTRLIQQQCTSFLRLISMWTHEIFCQRIYRLFLRWLLMSSNSQIYGNFRFNVQKHNKGSKTWPSSTFWNKVLSTIVEFTVYKKVQMHPNIPHVSELLRQDNNSWHAHRIMTCCFTEISVLNLIYLLDNKLC